MEYVYSVLILIGLNMIMELEWPSCQCEKRKGGLKRRQAAKLSRDNFAIAKIKPAIK